MLPTPVASDSHGHQYTLDGRTKRRRATLLGIARMVPTPTASDGSRGPVMYSGGNPSLNLFSRMFPTPIARDSRSYRGARRVPNSEGSEPLVVRVGGTLNPRWVEWLMGFPDGWTDLGLSATPSSRKSRSGSGGD